MAQSVDYLPSKREALSSNSKFELKKQTNKQVQVPVLKTSYEVCITSIKLISPPSLT
jgi:hypothetical protein